jgi:hypothetical protein
MMSRCLFKESSFVLYFHITGIKQASKQWKNVYCSSIFTLPTNRTRDNSIHGINNLDMIMMTIILFMICSIISIYQHETVSISDCFREPVFMKACQSFQQLARVRPKYFTI